MVQTPDSSAVDINTGGLRDQYPTDTVAKMRRRGGTGELSTRATDNNVDPTIALEHI